MESFLASNECFLGDPGGKATIMYVGLFYHTMLQKLWQHPARMSLIGAVAAFCELVPGAEVFPVDRERWAKMRRDTTVRLPLDMQKSIEMVFSLSFLEVGILERIILLFRRSCSESANGIKMNNAITTILRRMSGAW